MRLAERFPEVFATVGFHPQEAGLLADEGMAGIEELTAHPRVVAVGETGFDFYHDNWPHDVQEDVFVRHIDLARRAGLPVVIHTRDAADHTLDPCWPSTPPGLTVILHCFSLPQRLDEVVERGYYVSFAGNVTYKNALDLQAAARRVPAHLLLLETDAPWLTPVPLRGRPNRPALVAKVYEFVAGLRGVAVEELAAQIEANVRRAFPRLAEQLGERPVSSDQAPARTRGSGLRQVSLARLKEFGITPKRDLGQNFLIDDNILGVILGQLECAPDDVVLEVGAGLGVLTSALAGVAGHVHAFEVDRSLEAPLAATLRGRRPQGQPPLPGHPQGPARGLGPASHPVREQSALLGGRSVRHRVSAAAAERAPLLRHGAAGGGGAHGRRSREQDLRGALGVGAALRPDRARAPAVAVDLLSAAARGFEPGGARPSSGGAAPVVRPGAAAGRHPGGLRPAPQDSGQRSERGLGLPREQVLGLVTALSVFPPDVRAERLAPGQFVALAELTFGERKE